MQDRIEKIINNLDHGFDKIVQKININNSMPPVVQRTMMISFVAAGVMFVIFCISMIGLVLVIFGIGLLIWLAELIGIIILTFILLLKKKNDIEWGILTGLLISIFSLTIFLTYRLY